LIGCGGAISSPDNNGVDLSQRPFVDRHGHRHSAAILTNWTPAAIKALGIRRVGEGGAR
jgi:hypothetical protein